MTDKAFQQGFVAITFAFPGTQLNAPIMWETLRDLDGEYFLMAVMEIVKTQKELYPGSNIIAILREKTIEMATEERRKNTLRIEVETEEERIERWRNEAVPMPKECRAALEKIGLFRVCEKKGGI